MDSSAEFLRLADLAERDLGAWRELADRAAEANPFFDPDFVPAAARALGEYDAVRLLTVRSGSTWVGCLPVRRYRVWHRVPLPCLATWRNIYCLAGTPLLAPGQEREAMGRLVGALRGERGNALCSLDWIVARPEVEEATLDALPPRTLVFEDFLRAGLARRPDGDYLDGWLKSKDRREFRRRSRLLGEELGGEPRLVDRSGDAEAVEDFIALEGSGWKAAAGTALASDPGHAAFFRDVLRAFARRGALKLIFLEVGGTDVAATCDFVAGGVDFCFKVGYDERFARFAPGRDLTLRMIERFDADARLDLMDSCTAPDNDVYNRLWRDRRRVRTFAFGSRGPLGAVATPTLRAAMAVRDRDRSAGARSASEG